MVRLIYLLVLFCLMLLGGCAGYDKGAIRVNTPSASNVYVAQVDTLVKIVQGKDNIIDLDTGAHRVKVTFVGHTVIDTVVQVKGRKKNVEFGAWMGGMAVSAGVMTLMWSTAWLFILPPTAGEIVLLPVDLIFRDTLREILVLLVQLKHLSCLFSFYGSIIFIHSEFYSFSFPISMLLERGDCFLFLPLFGFVLVVSFL